jgi:DNA-binding transcriptional MocR family regulator
MSASSQNLRARVERHNRLVPPLRPARGQDGGSDVSELLALPGHSDLVSFAGGIPDPSRFPTEAIRAAYDATLCDPRQAASALQYSVPEGNPDLRAWIVEDMRRRDARCAVENVLVTSGSQQALDFVGKLFVSPVETILTSRPTFLGALQAFNGYEAQYDEPLRRESSRSVGSHGGLASNKPKFAYVMPEFENLDGAHAEPGGTRETDPFRRCARSAADRRLTLRNAVL